MRQDNSVFRSLNASVILQNTDMENPFGAKRYRTFDYEMKRLFGAKVIKLSVDAGFGCPNRKNGNGCIFCTESGSGEFAGNPTLKSASVTEQLEYQKKMLSGKWDSDKYIAYFQSYTNTYAPVEVLRQKYDEALSCGVLGLAIATRPDCLDNEVLALLQSYECPLWLELGLQTVTCHREINRGYDNDVFVKSAEALRARNIPFCVHVIFGLPWETVEQTLETVRFAVENGAFALKLHMLYIDKTAPLAEFYSKSKFHLFTMEEYIDAVTEALAIIPQNIVIHRITGDGKKSNLIAPLWTTDKRRVLNEIDKAMIRKNYFQGCKSK